MFEWVSILRGFVGSVCLTVLCHALLMPRYARSFTLHKWKITVSDLLLLSFFMGYYVATASTSFSSPLISYLLLLVYSFVGVFFLYRKNLGMKLYLTVTVTAIRLMCVHIIITLTDLEGKVFRELMLLNDTNAERMNNILIIQNVSLLLNHLLFCGLIILCTIQIYRKFPREKRILNRMETVFLLIPSLICLFVGNILSLILNYVIQNNADLYAAIPEIPWLSFMANAVMLAGIFITLNLFQYEVLYQNERRARSLIQSRSSEMQERIRELEGLYGGIRGMKHDMKNHLSHLAGLMNRAGVQDTEVTGYLSAMETTLQAFDYQYATGHPITDVVINGYNQKMKQHGISFDVEFQYPSGLSIDAFDIGIVLSNALENALTAAADASEPYVKLRGNVKNSMFFLVEIVNSFAGRIEIDSITGLPCSTKTEDGHGIGLQNIRECARKYMGDLDIRINDHVFTLAVMMKDNRD